MKFNDLERISRAFELLTVSLDCSADEIIECLEKRLISEEEAGQIRAFLKED